MELAPTAQGQLFVWTDVDAAHEADFNAWYDREHMEERVAIPGMLWARRYRARDAGTRRYLALYRTEALATFTSAPYRAAFTRQTDWSNSNFARMTNTQRRVMAVTGEAGFGAGAAIALAELADDAPLATDLAEALCAHPDLLRLQMLVPDPALSTPLPSETATPRLLRPVLIVDATGPQAADALARLLTDGLGPRAALARAFDLIWSLDAADLALRRAR